MTVDTAEPPWSTLYCRQRQRQVQRRLRCCPCGHCPTEHMQWCYHQGAMAAVLLVGVSCDGMHCAAALALTLLSGSVHVHVHLPAFPHLNLLR